MSREDAIKIEGAVVAVLSARLYRVELANGHRLLAHVPRGACCVLGGSESSSMQPATRNTFVVGDQVTVEMSPFDFSRGRISANEN